MSHRDPADVIHADLLQTHGGITQAARAIGRSPGTLHNKFSESMPQCELSLREAIALAHFVGTSRFAESIAAEFGGVFVPVPHGSPAEDDVLQAYLEISASMGELSQAFITARSDGVITPPEFDDLEARGRTTVAAILHLLSEQVTMERDLPPAEKRFGGAR